MTESPYIIKEEKVYEAETLAVYQAALKAIHGLEGKFESHDEETFTAEAKFHKTILKKPLGDRSQIKVVVTDNGDGQSTVHATVFPLNAIGQVLLFGARKGVSKTVMTWFFAHLEHHLNK